MLVVLGADHLTAHWAHDGSEIWRVGELNPDARGNFRSIASPVAVGDFIFAPYERGTRLNLIRRGGSGDITDSHVVVYRRPFYAGCDVPTACVDDQGRIIILGDKTLFGRITVTEEFPKTHHTILKDVIPFSASPIYAANHLYFLREDGRTFVFTNDEAPQLVAENALFESAVATPAFVDGRIYLRTYDHLFCIADERP